MIERGRATAVVQGTIALFLMDFKSYMPITDADGSVLKVLLADKGYGADFIPQYNGKRGGVATMPIKRNRHAQIPLDADMCALRNMVKRCSNKLRNARRVATNTTQLPIVASAPYTSS